MDDASPTKRCKTCGEEKDLETGFYYDHTMRDRRTANCKECLKLRRRGGKPRRLRTWAAGTTPADRVRQWRLDHHDEMLAIYRVNRRLLRFLARNPDAVTAYVAAYGPACLGCGSVDGLCWDHVVPLPAGANCLSNVQRLCRRCNSAKRGTSRDHRCDGGAAARSLAERWPLAPPRARAPTAG